MLVKFKTELKPYDDSFVAKEDLPSTPRYGPVPEDGVELLYLLHTPDVV